MSYVYTGAPDECSPCFVQGIIRKLDEKGECLIHPTVPEGYVDHPECGGVHHEMYRHCVRKQGD